MLNTQFKKKYYKVGYLNNDVVAYKFFLMRRNMLEFINTIGKNRVVEVMYIRELDVVEENE